MKTIEEILEDIYMPNVERKTVNLGIRIDGDTVHIESPEIREMIMGLFPELVGEHQQCAIYAFENGETIIIKKPDTEDNRRIVLEL